MSSENLILETAIRVEMITIRHFLFLLLSEPYSG